MKSAASRDNAAYKALAKLASSAAERRRRGLTVIEGAHLVEACLDAGHGVAQLFVSRSAAASAQALVQRAREGSAVLVELADPLFDAVSGVESPAGVLAVVASPRGAPCRPRRASASPWRTCRIPATWARSCAPPPQRACGGL